MIKDKNSINETYKSYAFIEFFDLEDTNKALNALNKGEIKLREEILCGNYSTKTEDKNTNTYFDNNLNYHVKYISYNIYLYRIMKIIMIN
jgi:RNA recognition motif-containing protein